MPLLQTEVSSNERPAAHRPPLRASPAEQVGFWLARSRRHGVPFDSAWAGALRNVRWPHDKDHRDEWKDVIAWSRHTYEAAYNQTPGVDLAMRHLRPDNLRAVLIVTVRTAA